MSVLAACHSCSGLPFLTKRNSTGGIYELEAIQFDAIAELLPKIKADDGTVRCA
jgi:hypothetical protein